MSKPLAVLSALLLGSALALGGCRPPEDLDRGAPPKLGELSKRKNPPPRQGGDGGGGGGDNEEDARLGASGLGKEDFALIEAEIQCVNKQFADDPAALKQATEAIMARYGAQPEWVERVRVHIAGEPDVASRLEEMISRRQGQICVDGTIAPELIAGGGKGASKGADPDKAGKDGDKPDAPDDGGDPPDDGKDETKAEGDAEKAPEGDAEGEGQE